MNKQIIETLKTIVIVALVTGILAFIGGVKYQTGITDAQAVKQAQTAPTQAKQVK